MIVAADGILALSRLWPISAEEMTELPKMFKLLLNTPCGILMELISRRPDREVLNLFLELQ